MWHSALELLTYGHGVLGQGRPHTLGVAATFAWRPYCKRGGVEGLRWGAGTDSRWALELVRHTGRGRVETQVIPGATYWAGVFLLHVVRVVVLGCCGLSEVTVVLLCSRICQ